jgi:F-type H+-transporting ATPase subunit a
MMNKFVLTIIICFTFIASFPCYADDSIGDFDVAQLILDHTGDAYEWHLFTAGEHQFSIPLPVIVYSKSSGFNVFMSSKLTQKGSYKGFTLGSQEGKYAGKIVEKTSSGEEYRPFDISITKNVASLFLTVFVLLISVLSLARWHKKHEEYETPRGFLGALDALVEEMNLIFKSCIGQNYKKFSPYLLTVFFFILVSNLLGVMPIFPGGTNLTGNIAITFSLAIFTFLMVNIFSTKAYWKEIFWPDVPVLLKAPVPVMPVIELFGLITKPFALMIRLFANILAGHAIIIGLCSIIFISVSLGRALNSGLTVFSVLIMAFMTAFELLVSFIQAYVFTMLSAVFIGLAQAQPHHNESQIKE